MAVRRGQAARLRDRGSRARQRAAYKITSLYRCSRDTRVAGGRAEFYFRACRTSSCRVPLRICLSAADALTAGVPSAKTFEVRPKLACFHEARSLSVISSLPAGSSVACPARRASNNASSGVVHHRPCIAPVIQRCCNMAQSPNGGGSSMCVSRSEGCRTDLPITPNSRSAEIAWFISRPGSV
jgi:hypothetical protein